MKTFPAGIPFLALKYAHAT